MSVSSPNGILTFPNATLRTSELQCNTLSLEEITFNVSRGFENVINTSNVSSKAVHISNTQAATSTTVGALRVDGGIACGGNLWCANLVVQGVDVEVGALDLQQVMVAGNTTARPMNITNTTATTGYTTGALTVSGGVGINSSLNVSGDVGIGTTNPRAKLDVVGNVLMGEGSVYQNGTQHITKLALMDPTVETNGTLGMYVGRSSNFNDGFFITHANVGATSTSNYLNFATYGAAGSQLALTAAGNVGIGRTDPKAYLHVQGARSIFGSDGGASDIVINDIPQARWMISTGGYALRFSKHNSASDEYSTWSEKVRIDQNGLVGIGTDTPKTILHVYGDSGTFSTAARAYFSHDDIGTGNTLNTDTSAAWGASLAIYANNSIGTQRYFVSHNGTITSSDTRIKKNIVDANDAECLETLRLLKPKKYQYKDEIERGTEPVWGFIAQEVRETLPYATQLRTDVLPNMYELANVSSSNVITFVNFNTSNLESNATTLIRTRGIDGEDHDVHMVEVIDEHTIRVEEDLSEWIGSVDETGNVVAGNQLFIYGQEVDDFIYLKKEAIWTVATAALQEVDRQLQAEKAKVATLETQLTSVLARLDALESANT